MRIVNGQVVIITASDLRMRRLQWKRIVSWNFLTCPQHKQWTSTSNSNSTETRWPFPAKSTICKQRMYLKSMYREIYKFKFQCILKLIYKIEGIIVFNNYYILLSASCILYILAVYKNSNFFRIINYSKHRAVCNNSILGNTITI